MVPLGRVVTVDVPATSANLGPGFDSLGLALGLRDQLRAEAYDGPLRIEVSGQAADDVPRDGEHLVWRAMRAAFDLLGVPVPGIRLSCRNRIPHTRGLGSSSAAIVAGIALARGLTEGSEISDVEALDLASALEGHPDNVAAAQLGGFTVATDDGGRVRVGRLAVHHAVGGVLFVPAQPVPTEVARGLLPESVSHANAAANAGLAALLVVALSQQPDLLLPATRDLLHQEYRREALAATLDLVEQLRGEGLAAVVSGAGPSVLALVPVEMADAVAERAPAGWTAYIPGIGVPGVQVKPLPVTGAILASRPNE